MDRRVPVALITGCRSGIGRHLAIAFAAAGVTVLATARQASQLDGLCTEYPNIKALSLNVEDAAAIDNIYKEVKQITGGRLDYLVNNAGLHYSATAMDLDIEQVVKVFSVNVFAVMRLCQVFIPMLRKSGRGRGTIVQIGSVTRDVPVVWQSAYNASKAALSQYSKTLRLELKPFGVDVVEVVTGYVQSDILRHGFFAPKDSLYLEVKEKLENMKTEGNKRGMEPHKYADSIVKQLVGRTRRTEIWQGALAWRLRLILLFPLWFLDFLFCRYFGLGVLEDVGNK